MRHLLSIFSYLSVLVHGLSLVLQTVLIGSTGFVFFVLRPAERQLDESTENIELRIRSLLFWIALALAVVQLVYAICDGLILMSTAGLHFSEIVGAQFVIASGSMIVLSLILAAISHYCFSFWRAMIPATGILIASVATSHAWSRVECRTALSIFDFVHQAGVGIWIGALPSLLIALSVAIQPQTATKIAKRFSRIAVITVAVVFIAGLDLSFSYFDKLNAVYGTAYGIMLLSKVALFLVLLAVGAMNKSIVERLSSNLPRLFELLRRNVEVEIGIGLTVVLAAASLTSQPPAIDLRNDRLTINELESRYAPRWPRFWSPDVAQLKVPDRQILKKEAEKEGRPTTYVPGSPPLEPETPEGKAWSEYNHNWAGLVIFILGVLAIASRSKNLGWARHWPLAFIGLAAFIFFRADPENWPLGPNGFWESFLEADVLQHRFFALLILAFAVFEWRVQTGRGRRDQYSFVFPAVCALGGALLFTHSHSLGNVKDETLIEWSHMALAFLAVIAGWSRWAELRSLPQEKNVFAWIWSICFALMGTVLMLYRES